MLDGGTRLVELTTRTLHGRFLLAASEKANDRILGVLGRAQAKYGVGLHAFNFMANHEHLQATVRDEEQMSLFMGYLNANLAKELGRLYDWREKFWGRRYHSAPVSMDEEYQKRRFMYILDNGCKEGFFRSPLDHPGVSSARALYTGTMKEEGTWFDRTQQYRASLRGEHREFPYKETVELTPLPFLQNKSEEEQRAFYVGAVREIEDKTARMHAEAGTKPSGARVFLRVKPHDKPKSFQPTPAPKLPRRGARVLGHGQRPQSEGGRLPRCRRAVEARRHRRRLSRRQLPPEAPVRQASGTHLTPTRSTVASFIPSFERPPSARDSFLPRKPDISPLRTLPIERFDMDPPSANLQSAARTAEWSDPRTGRRTKGWNVLEVQRRPTETKIEYKVGESLRLRSCSSPGRGERSHE